MFASLVILSLCGQTATPLDDATQFLQVMEGLHSDIHDLSLVCEGWTKFVGPDRLMRGRPKSFDDRFQAEYAYRNDGSAFLDLYRHRQVNGVSFSRTKTALLRDRLEQLQHVPDNARDPLRVPAQHGGPASLDLPESPQRIFFTWFFNDLKNRRNNYQFVGWETVDDRQCAHVVIDLTPRAPENRKLLFHFWIDMERGGHPLKIERYDGKDLTMRTHEIRLERTSPSQGAEVWLPISGVTESFGWGNDYYDEPIFRETIFVLRGSIRLNQDLPDRVFSVDWNNSTTRSPGLDSMRREFESLATRPPDPPRRTDPQAVREELDRRLAEADRQAEMVEASSTARTRWSWTTILQIGFGLLGVGLIVGALLWRRNS